MIDLNNSKVCCPGRERFKQCYLKRMEDGLSYKMVVLATAHKLIRVIFAMLKDKTLFDPKMN